MSIPQTPSPLANVVASKTYNAQWFSGATNDAKVQAAITAALNDGVPYVSVTQNLLPYNAANVVFSKSVHIIREGGNPLDFDVQAYGAAGDGVTNDTPAFAGALAGAASVFAPLGLGSRVVIPPTTVNTYLLGAAGAMDPGNACLQLYGAIVLEATGGGDGSPTLKLANATNLSMFDITNLNQGLVMRNLHLEGNKANQSGTSRGIWLLGDGTYKDTRNRIENVFVNGFLSEGIRGDFNTSQTDFDRVIVRNCGGDGWYINFNDSQFRKCEAGFNSGYGFRVVNGAGNMWFGGGSYANSLDNILVASGSWGGAFYAMDIDAAQNNGTHIQASNTIFNGCIFRDNGQAATNTYAHISVDPGLTGIRILGNHFKAKTQANQAQFAILLNGALTSSSITGNTQEAASSNQGDLISSLHNSGFSYTGSGQVGASFGASVWNGGIVDGMVALPWSATIAVPSPQSTANYYTITATSTTVTATISVPTNPILFSGNFSQELTFEIFNNSGGALQGPITFAGGVGGFKSTGTVNPGNGLTVIVKFRWNPARNLYIEVARTSAAI